LLAVTQRRVENHHPFAWDMGYLLDPDVVSGLAPATACGRAAPCRPIPAGDRDRPA
jgi:hypothetical protein